MDKVNIPYGSQGHRVKVMKVISFFCMLGASFHWVESWHAGALLSCPSAADPISLDMPLFSCQNDIIEYSQDKLNCVIFMQMIKWAILCPNYVILYDGILCINLSSVHRQGCNSIPVTCIRLSNVYVLSTDIL